MSRRRIILICLCFVLVLAVLFLYFFGYFPFYGAFYGNESISAICSNSEFWVGKKVCIQGVLRGSFSRIPEEGPPYSYMLEELQTGRAIGITWKEGVDFNPSEFVDQNVTVVGVVRKGVTSPFIVRTVYYIEAEETAPFP